MPNPIRGEATLAAGGKEYRLLLTLGALAEIEDGLGLESLGEIAQRLAQARAGDVAVVAAALLRGGGCDVTPGEVLKLDCDLGELMRAVKGAFEAAAGGEVPFAGAARSRSASDA